MTSQSLRDLRARRLAVNVSQGVLAARAGVNANYISRLETGQVLEPGFQKGNAVFTALEAFEKEARDKCALQP